jgi:universal stress protein A
MLHIQSILVPLDFSFSADHALDVAHSMARDHKAKLILFAVAIPSQETMGVDLPKDGSAPSATSAWAHAEHAFRTKLTAVAYGIQDVPVETEVCVAAPGEAIVAAAVKHQADLIVMGTHGRSGISRLLLGSVAEYVLRHAKCPVLTIKEGLESHLQQEQSASPMALE